MCDGWPAGPAPSRFYSTPIGTDSDPYPRLPLVPLTRRLHDDACGAVRERARGSRHLSPEVFEPIRRQLGVAHGVLDVLVPKPCLQRPRVVAGVS